MLELGTFKSFGVFLLPIRESLECSITALGTAMATSHSACYILGRCMYVFLGLQPEVHKFHLAKVMSSDDNADVYLK